MCGIAGIVSNHTTTLAGLPRLLDQLKHRGPDDEGYAFFSTDQVHAYAGNDTPLLVKDSPLPYAPKVPVPTNLDPFHVGLGHRRLSIVDLSPAGHQPLCDSSENYWIVFNGEIFNYKSIRKELQESGVQFHSETDTEVLLQAYIHWGQDCLNKLNGMWAFVIYDREKDILFGARDRFGVKPFYYTTVQDSFTFASEIKALLQLDGFQKELNPKAVFDYLVSGKLELDPESFFQGIHELPPAHCFTYQATNKQLTISKYFELSINTQWESNDAASAKTHESVVREKLNNAIELRLNADVKVGTCLSGGIDSSIIACSINEMLQKHPIEQVGDKQQLFTAVYPDQSIDEERWAKAVADQTTSTWNKTSPTVDDLKDQLEDLIYYQDLPFTSTSTFSQYKVMELVQSQGVKVTLDGQGADELFGGYFPHQVAYFYSNLKALRFGKCRKQWKLLPKAERKQIISLPIKRIVAKLFPNWAISKLQKEQPELEFIQQAFLNQQAKRIRFKYDNVTSSLNRLLKKECTQHTLKHILRLGDRNAMRFSVESRMPFADDQELINTVFQIPGNFKITPDRSKHLLRESFKDILPEAIYNRTDKIGFATPEQEWLKALRPYWKEIISSRKSDEFVDWESLSRHFDPIFDRAILENSQRFWRLINFALWLKVYNVT
ncbi:MAG: asparagine synthase (glutamine-hydrolyzing) [Flavobacteriales bacterium]|nr:asparagine synthase (glutamine-hydrolyzing) [Flavobacteriales bacterium]